LKEFMVANPPDFFISQKCCYYAKKRLVYDYIRDNDIDLSLSGVRKSEGGARANAYKTCFTAKDSGADEYRPIFWYLNETKRKYEESYDVTHSACYCEYDLDRTGCAGCPFGKYFEKELKVIEKYEPKLYKAVNNIFGKSYEYTRKYREFVRNKEKEAENETL
jgi:3'-phosphoadenosine 5'-phosphosulfate sulfotransferase (PAPS reductase)/FAD synthetase